MNRTFRKIMCVICCVCFIGMIIPSFTVFAEKEQEDVVVEEIKGLFYEFNDDWGDFNLKEYDVKTYEMLHSTLGKITVEGQITELETEENIQSYEVAYDQLISIKFTYDDTLKKAGESEWHLEEEIGEEVNNVDLNGEVGYGAVILQTSLDNKTWVTTEKYKNVKKDLTMNSKEHIIKTQLFNGCYYRVIVAYTISKNDKAMQTAEVYKFYASYNKKEVDEKNNSNSSEIKYFYAGAKNSEYTTHTKDNTYSGRKKIDAKDPHYGWDLGYFCLSGYTSTGDDENTYMIKSGNQVKLTFHLNENIKKLHNNSELKILNDKSGSDQKFGIAKHNMKHGELIIRHTDPEGKSSDIKYSDFLKALTSPGADTIVRLFEEGDYEVHLNYGILNTKGINSKDYYQTSFKFQIRRSECKVYIKDLKSGSDLSNGDVTQNGFSVNFANSNSIKVYVTKQILNKTKSGLVEDAVSNAAAYDGEEFKDEGIYTITSKNAYDTVQNPIITTVYVGDDEILTAYARHLNTPDSYSIEQLNKMKKEGYTFTSEGEIIEPVTTTTTTTTTVTAASTASTTTTVAAPAVSGSSDEKETVTSESVRTSVPDDNEKEPIIPVLLIIGGTVVITIAGYTGFIALKKKK